MGSWFFMSLFALNGWVHLREQSSWQTLQTDFNGKRPSPMASGMNVPTGLDVIVLTLVKV